MSLRTRVEALATAVGTDVKALLAGQATRAPIIERNEAGGTYALRNTVTSSSTTPVIWTGTVAPTTGSGYAIAGKDFFFKRC